MTENLEEKSEKNEEDPKKKVGSDFNSVVNYALTEEGCIDPAKIYELEGRYAHLPGRNSRCDVLTGPCACGAWH